MRRAARFILVHSSPGLLELASHCSPFFFLLMPDYHSWLVLSLTLQNKHNVERPIG